jgi:hypothetical protein
VGSAGTPPLVLLQHGDLMAQRNRFHRQRGAGSRFASGCRHSFPSGIAIKAGYRRAFETTNEFGRMSFEKGQVFGEAHLRRILKAYAGYYNEVRTHLSLGKNAPFPRTAQRIGQITALPLLGGLHHEYVRI